jgi:putative transposase
MTREHILNTMIASLPEKICLLPSAPPPALQESSTAIAVRRAENLPAIETLKKWQRTCVDARMVFIRLIEQATASGIGVGRAIDTICGQAAQGSLPPPVQGIIRTANQRAGDGRALSASGLMKWWSAWRQTGSPAALAPRDVQKLTDKELRHFVRDHAPGRAIVIPENVPTWLPYFLDEYRRPTKPSLADAHRKLRRTIPPGVVCPSIDQVRRICNRIPVVMLEKGRMTGAEYKSLLGYAERDYSDMDPFTLCQIDGHSFKAYVAHPTTGAHFHPEVCGVICMTTKVLGGWSWGLAESWRTVADAYRHCCTITEDKPWGCVPAILEADLGSGNMAKVNADEWIGIFYRVGTRLEVPERGGNPQGHGGIERSNQSIWIRAAKGLPTYTGKDMDRGVRKRIYTRLERDLKDAKNHGKLGMTASTSEILLTPEEFTAFLLEQAIEYNNTPHSALARITDPATGRRRFMTPFEALTERSAEGWKPTAPPTEMLSYLFMPHERIKVRREKFTLRGNTYHAYELCNFHLRDDLVAAFDIHDAERVWVMDSEEVFICEARWNGNRVRAVPTSVEQQAIMDREERRVKNLENKLELVRGEAAPALEAPAHIVLPPEVIEGELKREQEAQRKEASLADAKRYREITSPIDIFYMLRRRVEEGTATEYQKGWKEAYEIFQDTGRKVSLLRDDPYCLNDPDEDRLEMQG